VYTPREISNLIRKYRAELGFSLVVTPEIVETHYDEANNALIVIAADRPDKSAILGPGGRVLKKMREELGLSWVGVRSKVDLEMKKIRLNIAINSLLKVLESASEELRRIAEERILPILRNEQNYPRRELVKLEPAEKSLATVAFSGGVDSFATLIILWKAGLNPNAVSIDPGTWVLPSKSKKEIDLLVSRLGVNHRYVQADEPFKDIFNRAMEGRIHPCGECHRAMESKILSIARENHTPILSFGDLLPTGSYSVYLIQPNVLRFNAGAALGLSKTDTIALARQHGHSGPSYAFGCPLLREFHKRYRYYRWPSVQRVLRETRAGVLEPSQALRYVKSIVRR